MDDTSSTLHSPPSGAQRPKGILKNAASLTSPDADPALASPAEASALNSDPLNLADGPRRPSLPHQSASEKEITAANTLANAGIRRNSSNARSSVSRRHSHASQPDGNTEDNAQRLKWDEANIFLHEQDRGTTMKIDEPKTPFVREQDIDDSMEDEPANAIDPNGLNVDELDKAQTGAARSSSRGRGQGQNGADIPDLDLGEAEEPVASPSLRRSESTEKRVTVDENPSADPIHEPESLSAEAKRAHKVFEDKRKKHYEIPAGVVLGANSMDLADDDDVRPPMPNRGST